MARTNQSARETAWLTIRELADALDVTTDYARREVLRRVPASAVRRVERRILVHGRTAIESYLKHRLRKEVERELEFAALEATAIKFN
jgi:hypothetical protein